MLACRNLDKAKAAAHRIGLDADPMLLDLASLESVNNAGVTGLTGRTQDGFEIQFGVNHLGHFAFTGLLLDRLLPMAGSRVVTVSSIGHRFGKIDTDDLRSVSTYAAAKLANLPFTHELDRRLLTWRDVRDPRPPGTGRRQRPITRPRITATPMGSLGAVHRGQLSHVTPQLWQA